MTSTDFLNVLNIAISIALLIIVVYKVRRGRGSWRVWFPFITVSIFTVIFYISAEFGLLGDYFIDLSATLRLTTLIALLFYAYYMPPSVRK